MSFDLALNTGINYGFTQPIITNVDIIFDSNGELVTISGQNKLIQDVNKIFATNKDNYYPQYGTQLDKLIGTNLGLEVTKNALAAMLLDSLAYIQFLQKQQTKYQQVDGSELLENVTAVLVNYAPEVTPNPGDSQIQTVFNCLVNVQNASSKTINISTSLSLV